MEIIESHITSVVLIIATLLVAPLILRLRKEFVPVDSKEYRQQRRY